MWQQIDHHVTRIGLYTPHGSTNMMTPPESYTGVRVTEGVYNSGEKFVDRTPWFPDRTMLKDKQALEHRAMKERWKGKTFLELNDPDPTPSVSRQ